MIKDLGTLDGTTYDKLAVMGYRELLITMRNSALTGGHMNEAVILSHTIAILSAVAQLMENPE